MSVRLLVVQCYSDHAYDLPQLITNVGGDYECTIATSVEDAFTLMAEQSFDIVLCDDNAEGHTTLSLLAARPQAAVVLMVPSGDEALALEALKAGAADYIIKDNVGAYLNFLPFRLRQVLKCRQPSDDRQSVTNPLNGTSYLEMNSSAAMELDDALRHRIISELASDYAFMYRVTDKGDICLDWTTDSYIRITGYPIGEPQGHALYGLYAPEFREQVNADIKAVLHGQTTVGEYKIITKHGEERWLRVTRSPIWDENHQRVIQFYGTAQDITERKKAEEAQHISSELYHSLIESTDAMIALTDPHGMLLYYNHVTAQAFGLDTTHHKAYHVHDLFQGADTQFALGNIQTVIETNQGMVIEPQLTILGKNVWHRTSLQPVRDINGRPYAIMIHATDITVEKVTEHAIRSQNEILHQSRDLIALIDINGTVTYVNKGGATLLGVENPAELVGRPIIDFVFSENPEHLIDEVISVAARTGQWRDETRIRCANGKPIDVTQSLFPIKNSAGKITHYATIIADMTERKKAEDALKQLENHLRSLVDSQTAYNMFMDLNGHISYFNKRFHDQFSWMPHSLIGKSILDLVLPEDQNKVRDTIQACLANVGTLVRVELREPAQDNNHTWTLWEYVAIRDIDGKVHEIQCVGFDITKQKRADAELKAINESLEQRVIERTIELERTTNRIEAIFNHSGDGILLLDVASGIQQANHAFDILFGVSNDSYVGKELASFALPEYSEQITKTILKVVSSHKKQQIDVVAERPDGSQFDVEISIAPVNRSEQIVSLLVCIIRDITARKQGETLQRAFLDDMRALQQLHLELSEIDDIELLYQKIITLTQQRLGIDRVGLFILEHQQHHDLLLGTYGIDTHGTIRNEHYYQEPITSDHWTINVLNSTDHVKFWDNAPIRDNGDNVGTGWKAASALWNGHKAIGYLVIDNFVTHKAPRPYEAELISILGSTFGHLIERAQAERTLRESENMLKNVIENIPFRVFWKDKRSIYRGCNTLHARGNGLSSPDDIVGKSDFDFLPERAAEWEADDRHIMDTGVGKLNIEELVVDADGSRHWLKSNKVALRDSKGQSNGILVTIEDISERRKAEEVLQKTKDQLQAILDHSTASIFMKDLEGRILLLNRATEMDFAVAHGAWVGKLESEIFSDDVDTYYKGYDSKVIEARSAISYEDTFQGRTCLVTKFPIFDNHNEIYAIGGISTDITDRKRFEESLERALVQEKELGELKSRFVSMASHEFRTPLAAILATTETLTLYRAKMNDEQINLRLDKIRQQVAHMRNIMEDVLQLSRIQAGKVDFKPEEDDLNELCLEIVEEFDSQPHHHGRIIYTCDRSQASAQFDRRMMRQVISNLFSNGLKYSSDDKAVYVELIQDDKQLILRVKDEGIGIPPDDLKHLFEPFHRATNVGTISGTGLGLSITKQAIEMHHGSIVTDSAVGSGTTFTVTIPKETVLQPN